MTALLFYDTIRQHKDDSDKEHSMIAFSLTNIKEFMSHLLLSDTFDYFSFIEGEIVTFNTFKIDG
mgnify:CR=1 FL=1